MADIDNTTRLKLESILDMGGGYVLDFSNARFSDFVRTAIGIDPYEKYGDGSKAVVLRAVWEGESDAVAAKLNLELLEHWLVTKLISGDAPSQTEQMLYEDLKAQFGKSDTSLMEVDTAFLAKNFGQVRLDDLPNSLTTSQVTEARLNEIQACLDAGAPLAVIFLVGSTLEGLLLELALAQPGPFLAHPI